VQQLFADGLDKGSQYKDLVKGTMKDIKLMKLHFKKYELVKSQDNIVPAPKEGKPDEKIAQMCDTFVKQL
jgi:hypothetical protein